MMRRASIAADERHDAFGCVVTRWLGYSRADGREPYCVPASFVWAVFSGVLSLMSPAQNTWGGAGRPRICNLFFIDAMRGEARSGTGVCVVS